MQLLLAELGMQGWSPVVWYTCFLLPKIPTQNTPGAAKKHMQAFVAENSVLTSGVTVGTAASLIRATVFLICKRGVITNYLTGWLQSIRPGRERASLSSSPPQSLTPDPYHLVGTF